MRMQDKANKDSHRKSVGEISHRRQLQDERKAVQTRTFTRWMNVFLHRCDPPVEVHDLFTDIQDGRILMALLEELTGCKLLYRFRSSSHRIFRLNNISKALEFLDDRHVKLLDIDACGVADGIPSVVLNLVWAMILHFQVKEVTGGLQRHLSSSLSSLSMSSSTSSSDLSPQPNDTGSYSCSTLPSKGKKAAREPKYHGKAIKTLLQWVQRCTSKFGVEVHDFGRSWRSGLAFLAMIKSISPDLVDLRESLSREPRENLQLAFMTAHHSLDIPPLLEPEDVSGSSPDEKSIITYVSMFLGRCSATDEDHPTDVKVLQIPNFGSLESVGFGETLAEDPEAQALVRSLKGSSEQLLWKRWSRRSSGSQATKKSRRQPPSPLDARVASQEIRSWMEKASSDQSYSKTTEDGSHFSLSSEEGIYSLPALDSDEEDAYSYILDLSKEVFQPYGQLKGQVPRVEEETEEEVLLNAPETKHMEVGDSNSRGCKHQGPDVEPGVRLVHRTIDKMANSKDMFDMEPEGVVRGQSNGGGYCEEALVDESKHTELEAFLSEKRVEDQEENVMKYEEGQDRKSGKGEEEEKKEEEKECLVNLDSFKVKINERIFTRDNTEEGNDAPETEDLTSEERNREFKVKRRKLTDKKSSSNSGSNGDMSGHGGDGWTQSFREEELVVQPSCDITSSELQMLLVLWILVFCCFLLPQMNL